MGVMEPVLPEKDPEEAKEVFTMMLGHVEKIVKDCANPAFKGFGPIPARPSAEPRRPSVVGAGEESKDRDVKMTDVPDKREKSHREVATDQREAD